VIFALCSGWNHGRQCTGANIRSLLGGGLIFPRPDPVRPALTTSSSDTFTMPARSSHMVARLHQWIRGEPGTTPTARPGHRLPHAWLQDQAQQQRTSNHHLFDDKASWALLTNDTDEANEWSRKAAELVREIETKDQSRTHRA
jgi:hypothetical protein